MTSNNKTAWINEINGFATMKFAEKRAAEVSAAHGDKIRYLIFTNSAGRFVPVFIYNDTCSINMPWIASKGCAIIN